MCSTHAAPATLRIAFGNSDVFVQCACICSSCLHAHTLCSSGSQRTKRPLRHADPAKLRLKRSHTLPTAHCRGCARLAKLPSLEGNHMGICNSGSPCTLLGTSCAGYAAALLSAVQQALSAYPSPTLTLWTPDQSSECYRLFWNPRLQPILLPSCAARNALIKQHSDKQTHALSLPERPEKDAGVVTAEAERVGQRHVHVQALLLGAHNHAGVHTLIRIVHVQRWVQVPCRLQRKREFRILM